MANSRVKQNHWNYTLRKDKKVVKHGITSNVPQRLTQMKNKGLRFTTIYVDPRAVSKETALKRERKRITTYQKNHGGRKPRYNKV